MKKYYKCDECWSILETIYSKDLECLNCEWKVLEEISNDAPQWVKWCWTCDKKMICSKKIQDLNEE